MIKIVSFRICPFVQRVTAALEAKGVPYEIEYISLSDKPAWFLDISPNGQVPLLITEAGTALFESDAIVEYIEDEYGSLEAGVSHEQRALDRAWSYLASKHYLQQCSAMQSSSESLLNERLARLGKAFEKAEQQLADGPYFKGESLSAVDIAWLPLLHRAHIIKERRCVDMLGDYPKMQAWQQSLLATGLIEKSVSADFEDAFSAFYLSDKTYLGAGRNCDASLARGCC